MGLIDQLKKEYDIDDEWIGYEIHPETPAEGVSFDDWMGAEGRKSMLNRFNIMGSNYGLEFTDLKRMPNSYNALEAVEYVKEYGVGDKYHHALMYAYFSEGKDISDIGILCDVAEKFGIEKIGLVQSVKEKRFSDILRRNTQIAIKSGIRSTPTFIVNNEYILKGVHPIETYRNLFNSINEGTL